MLPVHVTDVVLWLHVLAACVWIGGQVLVAAVLPLLKGADGLGAAAGRRFQAVAWPAFAVLVATGIANVHNAGIGWSDLGSTAAGRTLVVKLVFVVLSGGAAAVHAAVQAPRGRRAGSDRRVASALLGAISLLAAAVAALLGVVVAQS
jgi:putative copper export protein